jgi:hypothetical protein
VTRIGPFVDLREPAALRRIWGLGIGTVMLLAVGPYPVVAFFVDDEIPHRIHNIVGALQYLPLWAVPVLMLTFDRDAHASWRLALASSWAMFLVGVASDDLIASLSWMPLATLIVLRPRGAWRDPRRFSIPGLAAALLAASVAVMHVPDLVDLQRADLGDSHSVRFHFSGMAAAYVALTGALVLMAVFPAGRALRAVVAGSVAVAGFSSLAWPLYESALPTSGAVLLIAAAVLTTIDLGRRDILSGSEPPPGACIGAS